MANTFNDIVNSANVIGTTFSAVSIEPLRPMYVFDALCKSREWDLNTSPNAGDAVTFYGFSAWSSNTGALSPTTTVFNAGEKLVQTRKSITLTQYGDYTVMDTLTLKVETFADVLSDLAFNLADQGMNSINKIARDVMDKNKFSNGISGTLSATYHYYASQGTASTMGALKAKDVREIVADLKADNVKPYSDGFYYAVIHPYQKTQLRADTDNASWTTSSIYNANGDMLKINGDIGVFEGVRFIENSEAPKLTSTITAYFLGADAIGKAIGSDLQIKTNPTLAGPFGNLLVMNWTALLGYGILRREGVRVVYSKADKR
jgi:N4-gp56 family major capsid protein